MRRWTKVCCCNPSFMGASLTRLPELRNTLHGIRAPITSSSCGHARISKPVSPETICSRHRTSNRTSPYTNRRHTPWSTQSIFSAKSCCTENMCPSSPCAVRSLRVPWIRPCSHQPSTTFRLAIGRTALVNVSRLSETLWTLLEHVRSGTCSSRRR